MGVHLCFSSILTKPFLSFSPSCGCAISQILNIVPAFTVFASVRKGFPLGAKIQGKTTFSLQPLQVWWRLGFLVFIHATQVQFLGRELRSCFMLPLTAASEKSGTVHHSFIQWMFSRHDVPDAILHPRGTRKRLCFSWHPQSRREKS